jgi:hypothetical protein
MSDIGAKSRLVIVWSSRVSTAVVLVEVPPISFGLRQRDKLVQSGEKNLQDR